MSKVFVRIWLIARRCLNQNMLDLLIELYHWFCLFSKLMAKNDHLRSFGTQLQHEYANQSKANEQIKAIIACANSYKTHSLWLGWIWSKMCREEQETPLPLNSLWPQCRKVWMTFSCWFSFLEYVHKLVFPKPLRQQQQQQSASSHATGDQRDDLLRILIKIFDLNSV